MAPFKEQSLSQKGGDLDMAIFRIQKRENPYAQIDKTPINDARLSMKAKGILCYLLSKPEDWVVRVKDIVAHCTEGEKAIYSGLKELEKVGYISKKQVKKKDGKFGALEYIVRETPINLENTLNPHHTLKNVDKSTNLPLAQKGDTAHRNPHSRHLTNNDFTNNDFTNKKDDDRTHTPAREISKSKQKVNMQMKIKKRYQGLVPIEIIDEKIKLALEYAEVNAEDYVMESLNNWLRKEMQKKQNSGFVRSEEQGVYRTQPRKEIIPEWCIENNYKQPEKPKIENDILLKAIEEYEKGGIS